MYRSAFKKGRQDDCDIGQSHEDPAELDGSSNPCYVVQHLSIEQKEKRTLEPVETCHENANDYCLHVSTTNASRYIVLQYSRVIILPVRRLVESSLEALTDLSRSTTELHTIRATSTTREAITMYPVKSNRQRCHRCPTSLAISIASANDPHIQFAKVAFCSENSVGIASSLSKISLEMLGHEEDPAWW